MSISRKLSSVLEEVSKQSAPRGITGEYLRDFERDDSTLVMVTTGVIKQQ